MITQTSLYLWLVIIGVFLALGCVAIAMVGLGGLLIILPWVKVTEQ